MFKTISTSLCLLALTGTIAFAQSSQGQVGANTGPTSPTAHMTKSPMDANARMMKHKHHMKKGMSMKKGDMNTGMSGGGMNNGGMNSGGMNNGGMNNGMNNNGMNNNGMNKNGMSK